MSERAVFITGTTSGIGLATAHKLDQLGFRVFAGVLPGESTGALLTGASDRLQVIEIDITKPEMIANAAGAIAADVGENGLYGLHNNAGYALTGPLEAVPLDALRHQFEVNVIGHVAVTQAMLPLLRRAPQARIVNTVSVIGRVALPFTGAYSMTKFAMEAFTDALRMELAEWNIPVIAIEPGSVATNFFQRAQESLDMVQGMFSADAEALYGETMRSAGETSSKMSETAIPPSDVAAVVAEAFTAAKPKTRYLVGREARILAFFARWLPDRRRDRAILKQYGIE